MRNKSEGWVLLIWESVNGKTQVGILSNEHWVRARKEPHWEGITPSAHSSNLHELRAMRTLIEASNG